MASPERGEVWLADLGFAAKIRPCLILSVRPRDSDRALIAMVSHTTSVRGTRFEVALPTAFLKPGAFDAQGLITISPPRLLRKLGELLPAEIATIEAAVRNWLGL